MRDGARQHIGVEDAQGRSHVLQRTRYLRCVHYYFFKKSVVIFRDVSTQTELSYSRLNVHVLGSGKGLLNFNSPLILPLSGCDVYPSEAARSGVK